MKTAGFDYDSGYGLIQADLALASLQPDTDGDGYPDISDNCPNDANPEQLNNDGDSQGDVCDADDDNDGLLDTEEGNIGTDPFLVDTDGDGLADGADGIVPLSSLPGGIDADGDDYIDGEQDLGTDPNTSNIGDLAPIGMPNNLLDAGDLVVLTRLVTGIIEPTPLEDVLGDMNGDNEIDVADLLLLQQQILNTP
jgi:hypothetical protein